VGVTDLVLRVRPWGVGLLRAVDGFLAKVQSVYHWRWGFAVEAGDPAGERAVEDVWAA
jgi:hypothetical protein